MSDQPVHHPDCKSKDPVTFPGGTICGCGRVVVKEAAAAPRVEETVGQLKFIAHGLSMFADFDDTGLPTERLRATAAWVREAADLLSSLSTEAAQLREALADAVPTNWTDPLLTGPDGIGKPPYSCQHIERLLYGVKARIVAALAERTP
jgi:hypothetical protein